MLELINRNPQHFLFIILLISRIGDVLTTYIATPNLKLEANPLVRKFRWPFAYLTILVAFVAYLDLEVAVIFTVVSLLVSASNASKMWLMRGLGEDEYLKIFTQVALRTSLSFSLLGFWATPFFFFMLGAFLLILTDGIGQVASEGVIIYALVMFFYNTLSLWKIRKRVRRQRAIFMIDITQ
ncbi:MAG: hypothetical protein NTW14_13105 [bacterium]|nr:hypothetical protein [bacterium]